MKTIKFTLIILVSFLISCDPEPVAPDNTDVRTEISGDWSCAETEAGQDPVDFAVNIFKDTTSEDKIMIAGFHQINDTAYAVVNADNSVTIPEQTLGGYSKITGTGSIDSGFTKIDWTYTAVEQGETINYTASFTTGDISKKKKLK